jgi:NADH-quinone oxidoreductase subunit J
MSGEAVLFYLLAAVSLVSAVAMVSQRNPVYSAFALIVTMCSLSGIFALLGSPFIAILQVIVYAGAIMVLFLFTLMLLNVKSEEKDPHEGRTLKVVGILLGFLLVAQVGTALYRAVPAGRLAEGFDASTVPVARILFSPQYLYVFEATSVLLLAAMVGAIALSKRDLT